MNSKLETEGFVYFFQYGEGGPIKIGFTGGDPARRQKTLQASCPYELKWVGCYRAKFEEESQVHFLFYEHHLNGEWFHPHSEIFDFVRQKGADLWTPEAIKKFFRMDVMEPILLMKKDRPYGKETGNIFREKLINHGADLWSFWKWIERARLPSERNIRAVQKAIPEICLEVGRYDFYGLTQGGTEKPNKSV